MSRVSRSELRCSWEPVCPSPSTGEDREVRIGCAESLSQVFPLGCRRENPNEGLTNLEPNDSVASDLSRIAHTRLLESRYVPKLPRLEVMSRRVVVGARGGRTSSSRRKTLRQLSSPNNRGCARGGRVYVRSNLWLRV